MFLFVIYLISYLKLKQTTKSNFMAKLHKIQIHYLSSKSAAAIVFHVLLFLSKKHHESKACYCHQIIDLV